MGDNYFYFDYASTTQVKKPVYEAMQPYLTSEFGNPSSKYQIGYEARKAVEESRETVANTIGANPDEIFFTSCGSEANTWAMTKVIGATSDRTALISPIEHHSVLNAVHRRDFLDVDSFGLIHTEDIKAKIKNNTYMISTMMVNNEVGTIQPVEKIASICKNHGIFYHVDAVQALGHIPIDIKNLDGVTTMSFSGHKIGAPKGIGALYIRKDVQEFYEPLICGGQQERGLRGGTENVAFIVGFAKACQLIQNVEDKQARLRIRTMYCWDSLKENIFNAHLNGLSPLDNLRSPNILNVSFDRINGEELVELLNEQGYFISTGSACNSDSNEPSHVLKAMGLSDERANSSIRISLNEDTTLLEINALCQKIAKDVEMLRG